MQQSVQKIKLDSAIEFTKTYRKYHDKHVAIREGMCLKAQYPTLCREIKDYHLFAGRKHYQPLVGIAAEEHYNKQMKFLGDRPERELTDEIREIRRHLSMTDSAFACDHSGLVAIRDSLEEVAPMRETVAKMIDFWWHESSVHKYLDRLPEDVRDHVCRTSGFDCMYVSSFFRQDCFSLDYDKLLTLGIPGMQALLQEKIVSTRDENAEGLYEGMLIALEVLIDVCLFYETQAREMLASCADAERCRQLKAMADALGAIAVRRPSTLREAIQLFWLFSLLAESPNYGRMDVYLGDFYCRDIDSGRITPEEAEDMLASLWTMIAEIRSEGGHTRTNARVVVGGVGRRNVENADRFAHAALSVTKRVRLCEPSVTLRFHNGQDPELMQRALDAIAAGCVHPSLYNDDVHVPMVKEAHNVSHLDAQQYLPQGCGEILIDHMGFGSPNNIINFLAGLDLVLHNGYDTRVDEVRGLQLDTDFPTFESLVEAFKKQMDYTNELFARRHAVEHEVEAEHAAFLFMSMLTDDCIERGRSLFDGGARYLGGIIETFGLTNVVDSLAAIKKLVYEDKVMSLPRLVEILDANFEGYEKERQLMLNMPKYGNDDPVVNSIYEDVNSFLCRSANEQGHKAGLDFFLNCNLNPGGMMYSFVTKASADGRRCGEPLALGNCPTAGRDRNGLTALLNSMCLHGGYHAGYVHNLKFSKSMFDGENRRKTEALLATYFGNGGCQAMITTLNRDDLERALENPAENRHVLVRIAGYTARYVDLGENLQREILNRTIYS